MEDWDLQAVVRGCRSSNFSPPLTMTTTTGAETEMGPSAFFSQTLLQQEEEEDHHLLCFPELLATGTCMQELEDLCRSFYPKAPQPISSKPNPIIPNPSISAFNKQKQQQQQQQKKKKKKKKKTTHCSSNSKISLSKRRKNQQKRVVIEVPEEELSSDMWAWRKYGQKPIKGSPYPRGYYKCSSSKGCLARKQVERSCSNPTMFIITYKAEHNHSPPTHRNSLAGSARMSKSSLIEQQQPIKSLSPASSVISPTTPLTVSMEEDVLLIQQKQQQREEEKEERGEGKVFKEELDDEMTQMSDDDDMFFDLEELRESSSALRQLRPPPPQPFRPLLLSLVQ